MLTAFQGWRRKTGILLLLMSLLLLTGWGRSRIRFFGFRVPIGEDFHLSVQSEHEDLVVRKFQTLKFPSQYPSRPGQERQIFKYDVELVCVFVPYFCLIAPLTVCSAVLLFLSCSRSNSPAEKVTASRPYGLHFRRMNRRIIPGFLASIVVVGGIVGMIHRNGWWHSQVTVELEGPFHVSDEPNSFRFTRKNNAYFDLLSISVHIPPRRIPTQKLRAKIQVDFIPKGAIKSDHKFRLMIVVWDKNGRVIRDHHDEVEDGRTQVLAGPRLMLSFEGLPGSLSVGELLLPLENSQAISRIRIELCPNSACTAIK